MTAVTVVIPAYNACGTIDQTLASLQAQTCRDFTTIVVDDGSRDGTADHIEQNWPGVTVIRQENTGPAGARNRGVAEASTPWIAFLDADDTWLPWRLELQLQLAHDHPDIILWCGEVVTLDDSVPPPGRPDFAAVPITWLDLRSFAYCNQVITTTVMLRRDIFETTGGFDTTFRGPEDFDLWIRIAAHGRFARLTTPLAAYRRAAESLCHDIDKFLPEVLRVIEKAYGPGGALSALPTRRQAIAAQYASAALTASQRGSLRRAVHYMWKSWRAYPWALSYHHYVYVHRWRLFAGIFYRWGRHPLLASR